MKRFKNRIQALALMGGTIQHSTPSMRVECHFVINALLPKQAEEFFIS